MIRASTLTMKKPITKNLEAQLLEARKKRSERAAKSIDEICQREKVVIGVSGFALNDGRLIPQIQIIPQ
jgi:hypothetical protein